MKKDIHAINEAYDSIQNKEQSYNNSMQNNNTDRTELVADSEQITDDVSEMFPELDEATKARIVDMIETYIEVSIETVLENPEWFGEDEA